MREKILIVDDEKGIVDMLKSHFERQSFQVLHGLQWHGSTETGSL